MGRPVILYIEFVAIVDYVPSISHTIAVEKVTCNKFEMSVTINIKCILLYYFSLLLIMPLSNIPRVERSVILYIVY